jgi:hypothetical protein
MSLPVPIEQIAIRSITAVRWLQLKKEVAMARNSITKRLREQNRAEKAELKAAKRQERKAQHLKPPTDPASERIDPPVLLP